MAELLAQTKLRYRHKCAPRHFDATPDRTDSFTCGSALVEAMNRGVCVLHCVT